MNSYHVLQLVGEGSYGRVYKGRKKFTGQVVALKFMPKVGRSDKELRSLKREIEIMRDLQHPNIVQLYDSFETKTEVVVVTEYAEGQLFHILEDEGSLVESQVQEIACQLVSALYYLHSHRILHRDMKPQNILLGKSGVVKLCDFGFARAMSVSTMVLTSIKGTPLYMSPELVEEKPYDHTADLWSLGCILYELHTGAPPFYTNSIFHLVQLIVRDQVKWPDTMSDTCTSFLKGLLTKDPEKRLSWPELLHHPFVADGVLVLSDTNVFNPLTVAPSPDMMALKLKQVAAKAVPPAGEGIFLRKAREQRDNSRRAKPVNCNGEKQNRKDQAATERVNSATLHRAKPQRSGDGSGSSGRSAAAAADQVLDPKSRAHVREKHRGQISRDYEKEFPSVEVGPQLQRRSSENKQATLNQEVDGEEYWGKLAQQSDPSNQQIEHLNYDVIIPRLKAKILSFNVQLQDGTVEKSWQILQPLKVLRNLLLTTDLEESNHIGRDLGLPHVLFDPVQDAVENPDTIKRPWSVSALGEIIIALVIYWDKHPDWMEEDGGGQSLDEFTKTLVTILSRAELFPVAPLAASVLSQCAQEDVHVGADVNTLTSSLQNLLSDSYQPRFSLPSGWGLCDGLLSLLLHTLSEHENSSGPSCLDPVVFVDLWKKIGTTLTTENTHFCSENGLFSFLSIALFVFTKDPYSCVPLFSESEAKCVSTLGRLLGTDCVRLFAEGSPGRPEEEDMSRGSLSALSCHLLCFPFALDLPPHAVSTLLRLYDGCGIVGSLLQVIQTLPPPLLELPLSLLSRLLLCDPERSVSRLRKATCGFFRPPTASKRQTPPTATASSLLADLLRRDVLWDSAVELLTLLSHVARSPARPSSLQLHLEAPVLHQGLTHTHDKIRAATCRLLGSLDPFRTPALQPAIFKSMVGRLRDPCLCVRRMACRAVGNWLGCIAAGPGFQMDRSDAKGSDIAGWGKEKEQSKRQCSDGETAGDQAAVTEQGGDEEVEGGGWVEEARGTAATLASLITDPDALVRRHCCAALGNLVSVDGAASLLSEEDVSRSLLRAACTDPHNAVRRAAIATLRLHSERDAIRQVLVSLGAREKLLRASQHSPPQCDYHQLIGQL